ncbi:M56 family metallopeptidase [Streptosporangium sp. CA-115845]|uniref:M56 family metallopeptidase n=1 Tax=Streptosporangium sp. CA-115845 TaxID=3240071 RepID=UPI003D89C0E8
MTIWLVAAGVALIPVILGGRIARPLASADWARRNPRAALVLWQAIGLAGGLGAIGIGLVAAAAPLEAVFPHGMHTLVTRFVGGHGLDGLGPVHIAALIWSITVLAWLLAHTVRAAVVSVNSRRRQRLLVDVVADHLPDHDIYILPSSQRVAYCVPGGTGRVVLSQGTVDLLDQEEFEAVLKHERAHVHGRHDLVLLPFVALDHAFGRLPLVRTARQAVAVLIEMIADDHARHAHGELPLARALVRMAEPAAASGSGSFALAEAGVAERLQRLLAPEPRTRWAPAAAYSAASLLLSGPLAILTAPILCLTVWNI